MFDNDEFDNLPAAISRAEKEALIEAPAISGRHRRLRSIREKIHEEIMFFNIGASQRHSISDLLLSLYTIASGIVVLYLTAHYVLWLKDLIDPEGWAFIKEALIGFLVGSLPIIIGLTLGICGLKYGIQDSLRILSNRSGRSTSGAGHSTGPVNKDFEE